MSPPLALDTPVRFIKGVGPRRGQMFTQAGIERAEELLAYHPFRYEDRTRFTKISDLKMEQEALISGVVSVTGQHTTARKRVSIFEMAVSDESGAVSVKFFNQPYLSRVLEKGQEVILFGTPRRDHYGSGLAMINPEFEILGSRSDRKIHTGRIVPIYRRIGQITTRLLRQVMFQLLEDLEEKLADPLPREMLDRYRLPERRAAFEEIHFPELPPGSESEAYMRQLEDRDTPGYRRMIFEELFLFQLGLQVIRARRKVVPKERKIRTTPRIREVLKSVLPFKPTRAQKRVLKEIVDDMTSPRVMNRLLQGDVGSGKTIVALQAIVVMIENGLQTALMAPTEILAEQHLKNIQAYLAPTAYRVEFLSSTVKGRERASILERIAAGEVDLVVGTHALIQGGVEFADLGLAVVDEQHRFGVVQRSLLMEKGSRPETLVMTATPIPRSLALTVYGDLDLSVLDEMPPGRRPVKTVVKAESSRSEVYRVVEGELARGRQAFVVYPLIEESEKVDLKAATEMATHLQEVFRSYEVGLIHGRLKPDERDQLMRAFKEGRIQVLVSTTVIEVGIDIPNATVMVVEHAERFGLSQLHQLRGRIGRGEHPGLCILLTRGVRSQEAYQRLDIMRRTSDGFKIAEKDLEIRGPGEFVGTRQSGVPEFLFANIVRDRNLVELSRREAARHIKRLVGENRENPQQPLDEIAAWWQRRFRFFQVG